MLARDLEQAFRERHARYLLHVHHGELSEAIGIREELAKLLIREMATLLEVLKLWNAQSEEFLPPREETKR